MFETTGSFSATPTGTPMAHVSTVKGTYNAPYRNSHDADTDAEAVAEKASADGTMHAPMAPSEKAAMADLEMIILQGGYALN